MPTKPYHAVLDKLPKSELMDGKFKRTALVGDHVMIQAIWLEPGHPAVPVDQHSYDQSVYVITGSLELVLNGSDRYVVNAGEFLYIPADVPHQAAAVGEQLVHALDIFAPVLQDRLGLAAHQLDLENTSEGDQR
ncbi:cupin domain-containing protein [Mycolicibacterium sp. CBM1]